MAAKIPGNGVESSGAFAIGATGTASTLAGIPFYSAATSSIYTHDVSGTDDGANYNTAYGIGALDAVTTGDTNVAIGYNAGTAIQDGEANTLLGTQAGQAVTSPAHNTLLGYVAGGALTTGATNIAIGSLSLDGCDTESNNLAIGFGALGGSVAGGEYNVAVGNYALDALTSADFNVAVGYEAGTAVTTGTANVFIGYEAGNATTTGGYNTGIGLQTLNQADEEGDNIAIGYSVLSGAVAGGEKNVAVGNYALDALTTGDNNVAIGYLAASDSTTAVESVAIGYKSLRDQTTAGGASVGYSIGIGSYGMYNVVDNGPNIGIGGFSRASGTSGTQQIVLGYNVAGSGDNTFTFGAGSTDTTCSHGATSFSAPSDERWKKDIETSTCGLSFINDLRPVSFKFKTKGELDSSLHDYEKDSTEVAGFTSDSVLGFVAQEVKTVIDNHSEFKGSELWKEGIDEYNKRQRISKEALIPILVKAVQELSTKVKALEEA